MSYNSFLSVIYLYLMGGSECSWYSSLDDILLFKRRPGMGTRAILTGLESGPVTSLLHSFPRQTFIEGLLRSEHCAGSKSSCGTPSESVIVPKAGPLSCRVRTTIPTPRSW